MPFKDPAAYRVWEQAHPERKRDRHSVVNRQLRDPTSPSAHVAAGRFIAVDGEGAYESATSTEQRYVLLSDSTGRQIWNARGLGTRECLEFLLGLQGKGIVVGFGLTYDISYWLRDLEAGYYRRKVGERTFGLFGEFNETLWGPYRIKWVPRRWFEVWRVEGPPAYVRVEDVLSNFQGNFEQVTTAWLGPETVSCLLAWGKAARGRFVLADRERITAYNAEENALLVRVMERYLHARQEVGFRSTKFYSPAVLAKELLRRHGAKDYVAAPRPPEVVEAQMAGFVAGHIEMGRIGRTEEPLDELDANSAYPTVTAELPNLARGRWEYDPTFRKGSRWSLYHVSLHQPEGQVYYPLPLRSEGRILYPRLGKTWVWGRELEAARAASIDPDREFEAYEGWHFIPEDPNERPFEWIREVYRERAKRKKAGDPSEYPLKISMNSVFGSLCQGMGWDRFRPPPFTDYALAGLITSETRARLWSLASRNLDSVVSFMTDALVTTDPHLARPSELGTDLGEFKRTEYESGGMFVMAGLYRLLGGHQLVFSSLDAPPYWPDPIELWDGTDSTAFDGWWAARDSWAVEREAEPRTPPDETRARGVGDRSLPFAAVLGAWRLRVPKLHYTLRRPQFIGPKLALARNKFDSRFAWVTVERDAHIRQPSNYRTEVPKWTDLTRGLCETYPSSLCDGTWDTEPYVPRGGFFTPETVAENDLAEDYLAPA